MTPPPIPVAAPLAAYQHHRAELEAALRRVLESGRYILGAEVEAFEVEFAAYAGARCGIGVASGTEALWFALRAVGVGEGDEVIVPSLTASATAAAIVETGARPVFADVEVRTLTLDPAELARLTTAHTRAILPVHLYGSPANLTAIADFARRRQLKLIEDCAQAHGARHAGKNVGTFGDAAAWSFYPTKNLGAFGDGGLVTTSDLAIAERLRLLREYGWRERYHSAAHGWNSRLDELQAAMLRVRLQHLEADNARRREIAQRYRAALPAALLGPIPAQGDSGVEHLFVIRATPRAALQQALAARGIGAAIHYPVPCHLQAAYAVYGHGPGSLPVTERACHETLSLPMYPELSDAEVDRVIAATGEAWMDVARK
jgi:dTDP-4-amino-4,6-dideoxygalactose transaminase